MAIKVCLFASLFRYEGRSPWPQATRISGRGGSNHREVDYINKCALPKGARRLLEIELIARELPGWVQRAYRPHASPICCACRHRIRERIISGHRECD
jgi:hypothetical protein